MTRGQRAPELPQALETPPSVRAQVDSLNSTARANLYQDRAALARQLADSAEILASANGYISGSAEALANRALVSQLAEDDFIAEQQWAEKALRRFAMTPDTTRIGFAYSVYSFARFAQSDYLPAIHFQRLALNAFAAARMTNEVAGSLITLSNIYVEKGDYDSAFTLAEKGFALAEQQQDVAVTHWALRMIATVYHRIGQDSSALLALDRQEGYGKPSRSRRHDVLTSLQRAEILTGLKRFNEADSIYTGVDSVKLNERERRFFLVSKGEFMIGRGDYQKALSLLEQGLQFHQAKSDGNEIMRALTDLSRAWAGVGDPGRSLSFGREAVKIAAEVQSKQGLLDAYDAIYKAYHSEIRDDSAFRYFSRYVSMKDSVMSAKIKGRIAAYTYEQTISRLNAENALRDTQLTAVSREKKLILVAGSITILLLIAISRNLKLKKARAEQLRTIAEQDLGKEKLVRQMEVEKHDKEQTQLEMKVLRSQMNPHFLFNSLNSINRYILQHDSDRASEYLTIFSKLVRMILQNSRQALIPLEDELAALRLYLEMESMRFNNRFTHHIRIGDEVDLWAVKIPPLILQPFVENAIWHGIMKRDEGGSLEIAISSGAGFLICEVLDDGVGRRRSRELDELNQRRHQSLGIQITSERIALLRTGPRDAGSISFDDLTDAGGEPAGTKVIIKIPLIDEGDHN